MKNLLLGIIAINLTFILFYLALSSVEPVHAAQTTVDIPLVSDRTEQVQPEPDGEAGVSHIDPQPGVVSDHDGNEQGVTSAKGHSKNEVRSKSKSKKNQKRGPQ